MAREVAIKVLRGTDTGSASRSRFEQEARATSALNHPNILAIHDVGIHEGVLYLVEELVDGLTIRELLNKGALPTRKAVDYGRAIAQGIAAAHAKGIIHRDLKPENVMVTSDGRVKILDFGLAKLHEPAPTTDASTRTHQTGPGTVLGTVAYMSPEQLRGQAVDHRSDLFSLGVVLFEMLSGARPFAGDTAVDTQAAILNAEPRDFPPDCEVPPAIDRVVRRCLEKEPQQRFQTASDLAFALEAVDAGSRSSGPIRRGPRAPIVPWVIAAAAIATLLAVFAWPRQTASPLPLREVRLDIATPGGSSLGDFALAPDGTRLIFRSNDRRLWVRPLDKTESTPVPNTEDASWPFWSPDGRAVGFFRAGRLWRINLDGGAPKPLALTTSPTGGAWLPNGDIVFAGSLTRPIQLVSAAGGTAHDLTALSPPGQTLHRYPFAVPAASSLLLQIEGTPDQQGLYVASLTGGAPRRIGPADGQVAFMAPDTALFLQGGDLRAARVDLSSAQFRSEPTTLATSVAFFSVSVDGTIAYRSAKSPSPSLVLMDGSGHERATIGQMSEGQFPEISPDGRSVAVMASVGGNTDVWVVDVGRGTASRATTDASFDRFPLWSPQGDRLVFQSNRLGVYDLYEKRADLSGPETLVLASHLPKFPIGWSHDGRWLLFRQSSVDSPAGDLSALDMTSPTHAVTAITRTPSREDGGQFSPDSKWIAFESDESGRSEIQVQAFPSGQARSQVSVEGGVGPRWSRDGKSIYFIAPDASLMAVSVEASPNGLSLGRPVFQFKTNVMGGGTSTYPRPAYAVAPNGTFVIGKRQLDVGASPSPITILLNWKGLSKSPTE